MTLLRNGALGQRQPSQRRSQSREDAVGVSEMNVLGVWLRNSPGRTGVGGQTGGVCPPMPVCPP